jgi:hypothetical protein
MSRIVLFGDDGYRNMLPLTYWRTVPELRAGRKILIDRTAQRLDVAIAGVWTRSLAGGAVAQHRCGAPVNQPVTDQTILTNARWIMEDRVSFPPGPCVGMIDSEIAFIVCDEALAGELQPEDLILPQRQQQMLQGLREESGPRVDGALSVGHPRTLAGVAGGGLVAFGSRLRSGSGSPALPDRAGADRHRAWLAGASDRGARCDGGPHLHQS